MLIGYTPEGYASEGYTPELELDTMWRPQEL